LFCNVIKKSGINLNTLFLELITHDKDVIDRNLKLKMQSLDYVDKEPDFAINYSRKRLEIYNYIKHLIITKD
jgi:hypothetical protein